MILPPAALQTGGVCTRSSVPLRHPDPGRHTAAVTAGMIDLPTGTLQDQNAFVASQQASIDQLIAII